MTSIWKVRQNKPLRLISYSTVSDCCLYTTSYNNLCWSQTYWTMCSIVSKVHTTGELGYDGLNGNRKIGLSYAKSVVYIWRILDMHRTGTKHMQKSVIQWSVISKFTCRLVKKISRHKRVNKRSRETGRQCALWYLLVFTVWLCSSSCKNGRNIVGLTILGRVLGLPVETRSGRLSQDTHCRLSVVKLLFPSTANSSAGLQEKTQRQGQGGYRRTHTADSVWWSYSFLLWPTALQAFNRKQQYLEQANAVYCFKKDW